MKNLNEYNLDKCNYDNMTDREAGFNTCGRNAHSGTLLTERVSKVDVLGNKNGVKLLRVCVKASTHFELYADDALIYKYYNEKTARSMFRDFSAA